MSNKHGPVYKFMTAKVYGVCFLITLALLIGVLVMLKFSIDKDFERANEIPVAETTEYVDQSTSIPNGMEKVSGVRGAITTINMNFYYYRETATDVMYIVGFNSTGAGITPMVNPDTGLPMKYSEYLELVK